MLKWMKVRQSASVTTPASSVPRKEVRNDETGVETEVKGKEEEEEDSGMEREDSVSNIELSDLKKVRLYFSSASLILYTHFRIF